MEKNKTTMYLNNEINQSKYKNSPRNENLTFTGPNQILEFIFIQF
jgi:hypothetical protein